MKLFGFLKKGMASPPTAKEESVEEIFRNFSRLLQANNAALELMADMEEKASGRQPFDLEYIRRTTTLLAEKVKDLILSLTEMDPKKYGDLPEAYHRLHAQIQESLQRPKRGVSQSAYTIDLHQVSDQMSEQVGGKAAHLGEVIGKLGLPVPDGFAVTTHAYMEFLGHNHLPDRIRSRLTVPSPQGREWIKKAGQEIRGWIRQSRIPREMEATLQASAEKLLGGPARSAGLALRSSAVMEDGRFSFAGQYATFLNISPGEVASKYKEIAASQFTTPALFYLENTGLIEEEIAMGVLCQNLIRAKASGILFTTHADPDHGETVLVTGVFGLGRPAVDGTLSPDLYVLDKKGGAVIRQKIAAKEKMLVLHPQGGIEEKAVPEVLSTRPCLEAGTLKTLWEWARMLEEHFHHPQDAEWALSEEGQLYLLQTRNLRPAEKPEKEIGKISSARVLLEGGAEASFGVGSGPVFWVRSEEDLDRFPPGSVLVAVNASPRFSAVMDKAAAIVTDVGSVTGHMAILAREFRVPALVETRRATQVLNPGQPVTVDTYNARVYDGRIEELLITRPPRDSSPRDTPLLRKLRQVLQLIGPLYLTDPRSQDFTTRAFRTFHDLTRFAHEMAIEEMFHLAERSRHLHAVRVKTRVPLNLCVFDLGGGFVSQGPKHLLLPEDVQSIPFQALWKGITHPGVRWAGPVGIDIKGLLSVMTQSTARPPEDLEDRTLALVSRNYLHFSSRLGYHYATVDSYCGENLNDNYITFMFQGGAADDIRRGRRARFIGAVLERMGFEVMIKEDLTKGQYRKFPPSMIEEKLDSLGRLMGCARLLDMTMSDDNKVDQYVRSFFSGEYSFPRPRE